MAKVARPSGPLSPLVILSPKPSTTTYPYNPEVNELTIHPPYFSRIEYSYHFQLLFII